ncbi:MAG: hypothetical protein CMJ58_22940 [Planctomycetaceae bacterium]|nr:hypothetical protein [Planctomycetaceae bacterium]
MVEPQFPELNAQTRRRNWLGLIPAIAAAALSAGCSDSTQLETAPVTGVVTLDGQPVTTGAIIFTPDSGWVGQGELDAQGRFALSTYGDQDGAIVGHHRVAIVAESGDDPAEHFERPPTAPIRSLIPERYADNRTSGLTADVKAGVDNEISFPLTTKPPRR